MASPHILIVSAFDPLPAEGRELLRYPLLAAALQQQGARVTYLTADFDHLDKMKRGQGAQAADFEIHLLAVRPYQQNVSFQRLLSHADFARSLIRFLNHTSDSYDLIISAFPPIRANARLASWARKRKRPLLLDVQDQWPDVFLAGFPSPIQQALLAPAFWARKRAIRQAQALTAVSADYLALPEAEKARQLGQAQAVFHLGAQLPASLPGKRKDGRIRLLLLAGSDRLPFLPRLLEQLNDLPEQLCLQLVGRSQRFRKLKPSGRVEVYYQVSEEKKRQLLAQADVGLLLSEPGLLSRFPNKAFSYLGHGLKVISNLPPGELQSLLKSHHLGLSCRPDLEDFHEKVKEIIFQLKETERQRIYELACQKFSKKLIYRRFADFALGLLHSSD